MTKDELINSAVQFIKESPMNYITKDIALQPNYVGMKIYEAPIFAFGYVAAKLYKDFKSDDIIGAHSLMPTEWLPSSQTVVSFFLPYNIDIKLANGIGSDWPSDAWLHGRYEGQLLINELLTFLVTTLSGLGFETIAPSTSSRFKIIRNKDNQLIANWSERHVAYACGLGTFGLSKGIITEKGMCGRFGSLITALNLPKDESKYSDIYEYCTMCGLCAKRCPAKAISIEHGKKHDPCATFIGEVGKKHQPRSGCGKCQIRVPCASRIPRKTLSS